MIQNDEGVWERQILVPAPSNLNRARQDHIYGPLPVPSPFRHPNAVATAQADLLSEQSFLVTDDGKSSGIDPIAAAQSAINKARKNDNYDTTRPPPYANPRRRCRLL